MTPLRQAATGAATLAAALCLLAAPVRAQLGPVPGLRLIAGADLTYATRYVFRGVTRAHGPVMQPAAFIAISSGETHLTLGTWANAKLGHTTPTEISLGRNWGELDLWAEVASRAGPLDAAIGVMYYRLRNTRPLGTLEDRFHSTEMYAVATLREGLLRRLNLTPSVRGWWDLDRVEGRYYELDVNYAFSLVPPGVPLGSLFLGTRLGLNESQHVAGRTSPVGYYEVRGVTHQELYGSVSVHLWDRPDLTVHASYRHQFNHDPATRVDGSGSPAAHRRRVHWWELAVSWQGRLAPKHIAGARP
jgi:hypothetical protein